MRKFFRRLMGWDVHFHWWKMVCNHFDYRVYECRECGELTKQPTTQPPLPEQSNPGGAF
jgi:hypothetical protein